MEFLAPSLIIKTITMEIEKQVCNLQLSKRLKELGVKQESLFWWAEEKLTGWNKQDWTWVVTDSLYEGDYERYRNPVSAFTVAELGEMLKPVYVTGGWSELGQQFVCKLHKREFLKQIMQWTQGIAHEEWSDTEADARAMMLIYLIENSLLKP